jgi:AcrR family transcriptional regulator
MTIAYVEGTVMPAPARTSTATVVAAGRAIVEREGVDALTMQAVADAVGVRAPSLYKRVAGRDGLVRLIADQAAFELAGELDQAVVGSDAAADLRALAVAFRQFARRNPATYPLLFAPGQGWISDEARDRASDAVRRVSAALVGDEQALPAARFVTAWAHGFVSMELADAFRLGGDVDEAWEFALDGVVAALAERH